MTERVSEPPDPEDTEPPLPPEEDLPPIDEGEPYPGDEDLPPDEGADGESGARLTAKVYGVPSRVRRGRTYTARIRVRNVGTEDATSLRVRLTRVRGVALSRRIAPISRVRSGKGVTVHIRVRLTTRLRRRTVPVVVTGEGLRARTSIRLRRR